MYWVITVNMRQIRLLPIIGGIGPGGGPIGPIGPGIPMGGAPGGPPGPPAVCEAGGGTALLFVPPALNAAAEK